MSNVSKRTQWFDSQAVIGWLRFGDVEEDPFAEVVSLTEAGRAALAEALREDAALEAAGVTCECAACGLALIACRCRHDQ